MHSSREPLNGVSHVKGLTTSPLLEWTLPQLLADTVSKHGPRDAAIFAQQGVRRSYAEFSYDVDRLASGLLALGFTKGDRIGIWSPNRYEWLLSQFATARVGIILVNINPAYRLHELDYALNKVGCSGIITARSFKESDYTGMLAELGAARLPMLKHMICMGTEVPDGMLAFDDILRDPDLAELDSVTETLDPNDAINIQFTSGTTGNPKGATLTHRNIVNNAHFTTQALELTEQDRLCIPVPFYHCFGMVMGTMGCVTKGAAMIVPSEGFDPVLTLNTLQQERCTACYGVPTMFVGMLEHDGFDGFDLSTLRTGIMAGAPCPIEVMRAVQSRMNMKGVTIAYGMTETSPVSFQSNVDDPIEKRVTSVGRIHPHVEVKLVGEDGHCVPLGEEGELWTRGYSVMQSYWDERERTAETIDSDGWLHSGDLARMDEEGYVNITGRLKDMIVRGGENIYPREIEEFLYTHPSVSQVQVFGIADAKLGEIVVAWIIPKPGQQVTESGVKEFCKGQIAHFKIPAYVECVDEIPMTVTGKPQKFLMRQMMMERLGLEEASTA